LNGFPVWFPRFSKHTAACKRFSHARNRYELSIETQDTETHYIISYLSWTGQWAWDQIAPELYDLLNGMEPKIWLTSMNCSRLFKARHYRTI